MDGMKGNGICEFNSVMCTEMGVGEHSNGYKIDCGTALQGS